ncbi:DNA excision repair protein ERCC-6-like isoform X2 [Argiope bruennichi]|uniref:DNA excision repair protein ERCC-6-like isoform X2 n=1 Tax=Argiope bruennichi TaxID=94029 RepID=UPI002494217B|nr:DNA excision repair protein ERCC-6-like isoform X2 [Argiope bruennichi]
MSSNFEKFEELQKDGKRLAAEGKLLESLHKFELARKIKETSKILNRIQKLKDAIGEIEKKQEPVTKREQAFGQKSSGSEKSPRILNQIQNVEVPHKEIAIPAELTPEILKSFNEWKSRAINLSYECKFDEALHCFYEAQKLWDCPKVKKYIQELEILILKYPKKLEEFQNLTDSGIKLASAGKQVESLKKLKNAFSVCPSPAISRMIKTIEAGNAVLASSDTKENHFIFCNAKSGSSGSEFSLSSGSQSENTSANPADLSPKAKEHFKHLYSQAREYAAAGRLQEALDTLEEAQKICPTQKVLKRITDLKEHMSQLSLISSNDMIEISDGFFIFHEIYKKLYPYQREGVAWMWKLFKMKKGGVLGDDMGLGKTFQVIAFLSGLIDADLIKCALIIMPVSLLPNWEKEFRKWSPGISVGLFHGGSKKERERNLLKIQRRGHVLLTSYGMVLNALALLTDFEGKPFVWDYIILDEGHKIKNPTKTTKAVHAIPSKNRLVLTGTPVQNNLLELWSLYDFAHQGTLLGSLKTFKMQYENTITRAREKDSTSGEKRLGTKMAENLKMLIKPYFLRRTKAEIWRKEPGSSEVVSDLEKQVEQLRISENTLNTRKNDLIVWIFLSEAQCEIYRNFLHSEAVKTILVSKRSPLVELTTLKKICDHPRLLSQRACLHLGLNGDMDEEDLEQKLNDESSYSSSIQNVTDETLMSESGKMNFLIKLLENLKNEGHRTLVFSLSRKILDMIHRILINRKWKVLRIDGTISKIEERERRIQLFQNDSSYVVFLLTTQVGGVGITLTAADRVIIYDPSWNPATDAQAVDRVYRIGQQKNVIVYRLITCGTVEEKIYRRQVFKDSITKQATCSSDPYRYFSKQELRELFTFENPYHSATQVQLSQMHSYQRLTDIQLDAHIAFLHSLNIFGISDHDLMFSKEIEDNAEDNEETAVSHDYIKKQVAAAQMLIQTEASVIAEGIRLAGTFSRPLSEHIHVSKKNTDTGAQMSKAMSSAYPDSKPKESFPAYFLESDREKKLSTQCSQSHKNSIHEIEMNNYDLDINEDASIIEPKSDVNTIKHLSHCHESDNDFGENENLPNVLSDVSTPSLSEHSNIECNNISKRVSLSGNNIKRNRSCQSSKSHKDSVHETEIYHYNLDVNEDIIELSQNDLKENGDVKENNSSIKNSQSIEILEQIIRAESKSFIEFKNHSVCESEATTQMKGDKHTYLPPRFSKSLVSSTPTLVESNFDTISIKKSETCVTSDVASPILCNQLIYNNSGCSSDQKNVEEKSIHIQYMGAIADSTAFNPIQKTQIPSGDISAETVTPAKNSCSLIEIGSASPLDGSAHSVLADLSFDDKPQTVKRKSCALPTPFVASDSDSSCSPSNEDNGEVLASTDSEEEAGSNSSICFVPSSVPNSPALRDNTIRNRAESPARRRITPLKVRKSLCPPPDLAFAQALASSPVIQQLSYSSDSEGDSPVNVCRTMGRKNVIESSDED